jgi:hypothetical protein
MGEHREIGLRLPEFIPRGNNSSNRFSRYSSGLS